MAVILAFDFLRFGCKCFWIDLNWHASAHQFFWLFISSCFGMIRQWLEWSSVLYLSKFCILGSVDQRDDLMGFTLASLARGKWPSSVKSSSSGFNSSIRLTARLWCVSIRKCWIWWWEHFNSIPMGWLGFSSAKVSVLVVFLFGFWCAERYFLPREVGGRFVILACDCKVLEWVIADEVLRFLWARWIINLSLIVAGWAKNLPLVFLEGR